MGSASASTYLIISTEVGSLTSKLIKLLKFRHMLKLFAESVFLSQWITGQRCWSKAWFLWVGRSLNSPFPPSVLLRSACWHLIWIPSSEGMCQHAKSFLECLLTIPKPDSWISGVFKASFLHVVCSAVWQDYAQHNNLSSFVFCDATCMKLIPLSSLWKANY